MEEQVISLQNYFYEEYADMKTDLILTHLTNFIDKVDSLSSPIDIKILVKDILLNLKENARIIDDNTLICYYLSQTEDVNNMLTISPYEDENYDGIIINVILSGELKSFKYCENEDGLFIINENNFIVFKHDETEDDEDKYDEYCICDELEEFFKCLCLIGDYLYEYSIVE